MRSWNVDSTVSQLVVKVGLLSILCGIIGVMDPVSAADTYWPGWLGPQRNGWVSDFEIPEKWPRELKKIWEVKVGAGYGSPLVVDGWVYQHSRQGADEVVRCLDLETGSVRWTQKYSVPFKIGGGGEYHGKGPKSSPVLDDGRIFTMSITGQLSAWDTSSGQLLWRRDYDTHFHKSHPYWGASGSPIVDGNRVIIHFGTDEAGALVALDVKTGEEVWSHGKDGASYSSPLLVEIEGVRQVIQWNHRAVVGVESRTGQHLWEFPFPHEGPNQNMPTPTFHQGSVLIGGENRGLHSLKPRVDDGNWSVKQQWFQKSVALDMSSAVMNENLLYGFSHYGLGRLFCLNVNTGEVLWQGPGRTGDNVMFLAIPGHILALTDTGRLLVIIASGGGYETIASYRVAESGTWAPPVLLNKGVLVKDEESLVFWSFGQTNP